MADNESVVREFLGAISRWDKEGATQLLAESFTGRMPGMPEIRGREAWAQLAGMFETAFPDLDLRVEETVVAGDMVAARWTWTATHKGDFMGVPASGKKGWRSTHHAPAASRVSANSANTRVAVTFISLTSKGTN